MLLNVYERCLSQTQMYCEDMVLKGVTSSWNILQCESFHREQEVKKPIIPPAFKKYYDALDKADMAYQKKINMEKELKILREVFKPVRDKKLKDSAMNTHVIRMEPKIVIYGFHVAAH